MASPRSRSTTSPSTSGSTTSSYDVAEGAGDPLRPASRSRSSGRCDDIDFDVEEGATVGLLGHNGSGKSTLLKCVAGILQPTDGRDRDARPRRRAARARRRLPPRAHRARERLHERVDPRAARSDDIERVFDEIVAFAELEKFIDMQVRHYSSGMYVRLGFAVAVNVDPDILLVDEVLAVGDEAFQRKCLERVAQVPARGPHDPVRHPRGRPRAPDLRPRGRARPR